MPAHTEQIVRTTDNTEVDESVIQAELVADAADQGSKLDDVDDMGDQPDLLNADGDGQSKSRRISWIRVVGYGVMPILVLFLAGGVGYLKWRGWAYQQSDTAAVQSVAAASDTTVALLSYKADRAEQQLTDASNRLTGSFRDDYTKLIDDLVIPGAKQKHISVTATVPEAASVSATSDHAVVLVYVNQTTTIDGDPPTDSSSAVQVTLDKEGDKWLVSKFDPV